MRPSGVRAKGGPASHRLRCVGVMRRAPDFDNSSSGEGGA